MEPDFLDTKAIAERIYKLRYARHLSRKVLGERIARTDKWLQHIESDDGKANLTPSRINLLAEVLGVTTRVILCYEPIPQTPSPAMLGSEPAAAFDVEPPSQLQLPPDVMKRLLSLEDIVRRRDFLQYALLLGSSAAIDGERIVDAIVGDRWKVDSLLLNNLAALTSDFESRFQEQAPIALLPEVRSHLRVLSSIADSAPNSDLRSLSLQLACRTATMASWISGRLENVGDARSYAARAKSYARESHDRQGESIALIVQSTLYSRVPHGGDLSEQRLALRLLDEAESVADPRSHQQLLVSLYAWRAEEHAASGDETLACQDLDAADRALDRSDAEFPPLLGEWDASRLAAYAGNCGVLLASSDPKKRINQDRFAEVIPQLERVVSETRPHVLSSGTAASKSSALGFLAMAYASQHDEDGACKWTDRYLTVALKSGIPRNIRRVARVRRHLDPWSDSSAVRELDNRLTAALT